MYRTRTFAKGFLVVGVAVALCGYALAAGQSTQADRDRTSPQRQQQIQTQRQQTTQQGPAAQQGQMLHRTSKLIGKDVKNAQDEDLGSIYDLVLTPDHQQVSYAAVSYGGTWGIGAKYFAVPWSAVEVGPEGDVTLSVSKSQLEQVSGFDRDNWPAQPNWQLFTSMRQGQTLGQRSTTGTQREPMDRDQDRDRTTSDTDRTRTNQTAGRTGTQRQGTTGTMGAERQTADADTERQGAMDTDRDRQMTGRTGAGMGRGAMAMGRDIEYRRVTNLTGANVTNAEGEDIGNIEDFVIDTQQGQVAYTVVSFGGFWGIGEKYAAVPASAIRLNPRQDTASLNTDRQTLESIAFEPGNFPDLTNSQYAQQLHQTFGAEPYWIILGFVSPEQQQQASERAWGPQSEFARQYNAENAKTVQGTVQSIGTFQPEGAGRGVAQGLRIRLTTQDGNLVTVYAGPQWYAQQHDFYVKPGDTISVTGSETKVGWRQVLVASQIKAGNRTLQLRNETGQPLWQAQSQGQPGQEAQPGPRQGTTSPRTERGTETRQPGSGAGQSGQDNP